MHSSRAPWSLLKSNTARMSKRLKHQTTVLTWTWMLLRELGEGNILHQFRRRCPADTRGQSRLLSLAIARPRPLRLPARSHEPSQCLDRRLRKRHQDFPERHQSWQFTDVWWRCTFGSTVKYGAAGHWTSQVVIRSSAHVRARSNSTIPHSKPSRVSCLSDRTGLDRIGIHSWVAIYSGIVVQKARLGPQSRPLFLRDVRRECCQPAACFSYLAPRS